MTATLLAQSLVIRGGDIEGWQRRSVVNVGCAARSTEQVKQKLMDAGYSSITELEADDGHWEGEGLKNGVKMEFHVDPKTGAITKEKPDKD